MSKAVFVLRTIHTLFAIFFITCIVYIYYSALAVTTDFFLAIAIGSLVIEGILVFVINQGNCPLAPLQRKLDDPIPFFNLFLPENLAKKAVPFFTGITFLGILLLILRLTF